MNIDALLDLIGKLGIAIALGITLWYFILTPRKHHDGTQRSSFLVPGWIHDSKISEIETLRAFYERMQADSNLEHERRIQEWRGFRDEETVRRKDAERQREKLLEAVNGLSADVEQLLELARAQNTDGGTASGRAP